MAFRVREQGQVNVVVLEGEVDLSTSPEARRLILESIDQGLALAVDLSAVSYIDSSGVASLVEGYQNCRTRSLRFGLVGVSDSARSVLELARLDQIFPIFPSMAEYQEAGQG